MRLAGLASASGNPTQPRQIAQTFKRGKTQRVAELLDTLTALGQARQTEDGRYVGG